MGHLKKIAVALGLLTACWNAGADAPRPGTPGGSGLPSAALRVQRVEIMDANGFERPMPASFGFIPANWRAQGGVQWGQQFMCTNGYNINWTATSPDGSQTIAFLPMARWETNNYGAGPSTPGCRSAPFTSARQYLEQLVPQLKRGSRTLDFRPRPDIAQRFAYLNMTMPGPMGEFRTWVEAGEVLFVFNEQGREMRGVIAAALVFSLSRTAGLNPGQTMDAITAFSFPVFAATAPSGQLNKEIIETIRQSFIPNPAWEARINKHNTAIAKGALDESAKRSRIIAEYNDYVSVLRAEVQAARDQSNDRIQRERGEVIRGVETYNDSSAAAGQVELSSYYDNAWRLNDGTYVLSENPSFDPWKDLGLEGRKLEPVR